MAFNQLVDKSPVAGIPNSVTPIIEANPARKALLLQNVSAVNIGIAIRGTTPSVTGGAVGGAGTIVLTPGAGIVLDGTQNFPTPTNALDAIADSGSGNALTVLEL